MLRFYVLVFLLFRFISLAYSQDDQLEFDLIVNPDFAKYEKLLSKPSIFSMALQSSGSFLSNSSNVEYITSSKLKIKYATLEFIEQKKNIYEYLISIKIPLGISEGSINIPLYLNIKNIKTGSAKIILYVPGNNLIPDLYINRFNEKLNLIASKSSQDRLLSYLASDQISLGTNDFNNVIFENIIFDTISYTKKNINTSEYSINREDTNEKSNLPLVSILIWFLCLPFFFYFLRNKRLIKDIK